MPLYRVSLNGVPRWYYLRTRFPFPGRIALQQPETTRHMEAVGSSRFYLEPRSNTLFKLIADKFTAKRQPLNWWLRDILEKRLLGGFDALKEWRSNRLIRRAGLKAVACRGVGLAINPLNPLGSLLAMEYLASGESGETHFLRLDETARLAFIRRLCDDAAVLIHHGYCHRDFHYGNVWVDAKGDIVWIDTHVKRLPRRADRRRQAIDAMLSPSKLKGDRYRRFAHGYLHERLGRPA